MPDLSVQQQRQVNTYMQTHHVSRQQAVHVLFGAKVGVKQVSRKGTQVEHNTSAPAPAKKKSVYNLNANTKKQGEQLAVNLYNQIQGASLNKNTIALLKQIKPENVVFVLDKYNQLTKGKESLAQAIDAEWGLDAATVKEYICPALVKLAKDKGVTGIYYGDYMKITDMTALNRWINNSQNRLKSSLKIKNLGQRTQAPAKKPHVNRPANKPAPAPRKPALTSVRNGRQLALNLYNQIDGPSLNKNTIELLKQIKPQNVISVLESYSKISKGKESLAQAIDNEWGLDSNTVKQYICKPLVQLAKSKGINGIYFGDYMKIENIDSLNNWIEKAKHKINLKVKADSDKQGAKNLVTGDVKLSMQKVDMNALVQTYANAEDAIYQEKIERQAQTTAKLLFDQIQGLSNPIKTRKMLNQNVNSDNVVYVMKAYEKFSGGKETLADAVANEYGLTSDDVKFLGGKLIIFSDAYGINIKNLWKQLDAVEDKKSAAKIVNKMYACLKNRKQKEVSLKPYINGFGVPYISDAFKDKTDISLEEAILKDPTISNAEKIKAMRKSFSERIKIAQASGINVNDIINNANKDFQDFGSSYNFGRYIDLYTTTLDKLNARIYDSPFTPSSVPSLKPNGRIDKNFSQGDYTGDCWLLAAIKGISLNPKGRQILNNSIRVNPNGSVTVHLKGVNKTYTITQKEIDSSCELSSGDGDVRALEIAMNRYIREGYKAGIDDDASIDGNFASFAFKVLLGKPVAHLRVKKTADIVAAQDNLAVRNHLGSLTQKPTNMLSITDEDIDNFNNSYQITCVSTLEKRNDVTVGTNSASPSKSEGLLVDHHEYTVTHSDRKFVYLINPWDTSTELKVDRNTFKNFFNRIQKFTL